MKTVFLIFIVAFISSCGTSLSTLDARKDEKFEQSRPDTTVNFNQLVINDTNIYSLMDSAIFYNEKCPYNKRGLKSFFFLFIVNNENQIALGFSSEQNYEGIILPGFNKYGCFYYKGYFFLVIATGVKDEMMNLFVKKTKGKEKIVIHLGNKPILYPENSKLPYGVFLGYKYNNGLYELEHKTTCNTD